MDVRFGHPKKTEHWRIDAFELWYWRRLLRAPWTAKRSNQSILKEISHEYSLEGLMLNWNSNTLATWCEELTHLKRPWCRERLKAGGERDDRGWDSWMASPTAWTWVWVNSGNWWWTGKPGMLQSMGYKESDTTEWLNWTDYVIWSSTQWWPCAEYPGTYWNPLFASISPPLGSWAHSRQGNMILWQGWSLFVFLSLINPKLLSPNYLFQIGQPHHLL